MVILLLLSAFVNTAIATQAWTTVNDIGIAVFPTSTSTPTSTLFSTTTSLNPCAIDLAHLGKEHDGWLRDSSELQANAPVCRTYHGAGLKVRDTEDTSSFLIPSNGVTITVITTQGQSIAILPPPSSSLRPTSSTPSRISTTATPLPTSNPSISAGITPSPSEVPIPTIIIPPPPPISSSSGGSNSSPDSNALRSTGISNSIIAVISALSVLAGLSLLIFVVLCLRAYRRRRQAMPSRLPDPEQDIGADPRNSIEVASTTFSMQAPPVMPQQRPVDLERPAPNPYPLLRSIDPFQESPPPNTIMYDEDGESVNAPSSRTRRGTIASSVTSFNMTSPIWLFRSLGPSTRQSSTTE